MQTLPVVWKTGKLDSSGKNVCFSVQMLIANKIIALSLHTLLIRVWVFLM